MPDKRRTEPRRRYYPAREGGERRPAPLDLQAPLCVPLAPTCRDTDPHRGSWRLVFGPRLAIVPFRSLGLGRAFPADCPSFERQCGIPAPASGWDRNRKFQTRAGVLRAAQLSKAFQPRLSEMDEFLHPLEFPWVPVNAEPVAPTTQQLQEGPPPVFQADILDSWPA